MGKWNWQVNEGALQQAAVPLESSPGLTAGVLWDRRTSPCLSVGVRHMQKCVFTSGGSIQKISTHQTGVSLNS